MRKEKVILVLFLLFTLLFQGIPGTSIAWIPNVNAADYTDGGCVAWVKDRASQIGITLPPTGLNKYGKYGASAYWTTLSSYAHGSEPAANSLAVWEFNNQGNTSYGQYGHVAYVESVSGDNVTVTEGGCAGYSYNGNTGVICRTQSKSKMATLGGCSGFYGYIYLGTPASNPTPANPVTFADQNINGTWDTNAEVYVKIMNPNRQSITKVGCYLYDQSGNLVKSYYEDCNYTTSYVNYNCNVNNDMGYTLKSGTTYKYVLYAIANGVEYKDSERTFKTTGSSDAEKPVISDITIETYDGYWEIKCKAIDNVGVNRVQFPTWTVANGQDDIQSDWTTNSKASGIKNGDYYTYTVRKRDHNNENGIYNTHIYAFDGAGNNTCIALPQITCSSENPFTESIMSDHKIVIGDSEQLNCGFTATWNSSNPEIAVVDSKTGLVTGVAEGETTITATANNVTWSRKIQIVQDCEIQFFDSRHIMREAEGKDARVMQIVFTAHNHSQFIASIKVTTEVEKDGKTIKKEQVYDSRTIEKGEKSAIWLPIDRKDFENADGIYKTTCEMTNMYGETICKSTEYSFKDYKNNIYIKMQLGEEKVIDSSVISDIPGCKLYPYDVSPLLFESEGKVIVDHDNNYKLTATETGRTYLVMINISFATRTLIIVDVEDPNKPVLDPVLVSSVELDVKTFAMKVGDKKKINATVLPQNATDKTIVWLSSNTKVLNVDKNGNVSAIGAGSANIVAMSADGSEVKAQCTVNVSEEETTTQQPTTEPVTTEQVKTESTLLVVGTQVTVGNGIYKVTKSASSVKEVTYVNPKSKNETSVSIPDTIKISGFTYKVTSVAANALANNKKVTKVTVGKNVTSIGKNAFKKCTKLKTVTLKSTSLKSIGSNAFYGDKNLKNITIKSSKLTSTSVGKNAFKGTNKKLTIKVPKKKVSSYKKFLKKKGNTKITVKKG